MTEPAPETETVPIAITVLAVEHCHGRGKLLAQAAVELDIGGISIAVHGIRLEAQPDGTVATCPPAYRHASSGRWMPAVGLPEVLRLAVAAEIAAAVRNGEQQ